MQQQQALLLGLLPGQRLQDKGNMRKDFSSGTAWKLPS